MVPGTNRALRRYRFRSTIDNRFFYQPQLTRQMSAPVLGVDFLIESATVNSHQYSF